MGIARTLAFIPLNARGAFPAIARRRSVSAVARELGVSVSALRQSVEQPDTRVGAALLVRTSRKVTLTDAGQRLLEHADPAVEQARAGLMLFGAGPG